MNEQKENTIMRKNIFVLCALLLCLLCSGGQPVFPATKSAILQEKGEETKKEGLLRRAARTILNHHDKHIFGKPHSVQVVPLGYLDFRTGMNFGFHAVVKASDHRPYRYRLDLQMIASHLGSHKHKLIFHYPNLATSGFGIRVRAEWERDLEAHYFGPGNDSQREEEILDKDSQNFIDEEYYIYNLKRPRMTVHGIGTIFNDIAFWFGLGFEFVQPQFKHGQEKSFLGLARPFGHLGGSGIHLSLRLVRDTRNQLIFPTSGTLSEVSYEPNWTNVKVETEGADPQGFRRGVTFQRFTISNAQFLPLMQGRLIFANRAVFESITGSAPFYALGEFAGSSLTRGLGGSQSLRGFESRRFQDKLKLITLTELRFKYRQFRYLTHKFDLIFTAFLDNGRVWHDWSELAFKNLHSTYGLGVWLNWRNNFVVRLDVGRSPEGVTPYFRLNTSF